MNDEQITAEIISVNCIFCGEEGEVFAGTLASDEDYVCDACYDMYLETKEVIPDDRQADSEDADSQSVSRHRVIRYGV